MFAAGCVSGQRVLPPQVAAYDAGWRHVKLYFMIGLPGEQDGDVIGIADTVRFLQRETNGRGAGRLRLTLTVSNFTPKPHTPFQWHSVSAAELRRKQAQLRDAMRRLADVRVNYSPVRLSAMEDFLGRGDRRLGAVLRGAWARGACNEAWWEGTDAAFAAWDGAIAAAGLGWKYRQHEAGEWDVLAALGDARFRGQGQGGRGRLDRGALSERRLDAPLPWDVVDTGISRAWLKADLQRALEGTTVPDCSHTVCSECGVVRAPTSSSTDSRWPLGFQHCQAHRWLFRRVSGLRKFGNVLQELNEAR